MNGLAKELNVTRSLKKFFIDSLGSDKVTFDVSLAAPDVRVQGAEAVKQWYNVSFGPFGRETLSTYEFEIFCMSRQDYEGVLLSSMSDTIIDLLTDSEKTDGAQRIPLFNTEVYPWEQISSMFVQQVADLSRAELKDTETKIKTFLVKLRWGTVI